MSSIKEMLSIITSNGDSAAIATGFGGFAGGTTGYNDSFDAYQHAYGTAKLVEYFGDDNFVRAL